MHHLRQFAQGNAYLAGVAQHLFGGEGEERAIFQFHLLFGEVADSDLGAGQVGHDGHVLAGFTGGGADALDQLAMLVEIAMGEVQPGNIHARLQHPLQHFRRIRGRADGADNLGLVFLKKDTFHLQWYKSVFSQALCIQTYRDELPAWARREHSLPRPPEQAF